MIELPGSLREFLIERVEEEMDTTKASDPVSWTHCVLHGIDALGEELDEELGENLVPRLEQSAELEEPLATCLVQVLAAMSTGNPVGEDLVGNLDKLCEIVWIDEDGDDEIAKGFLDGTDDFEEDEF
jgi:hypothetical protein